jgi:preprotein translocase subunit YajC
MTNWRTDNVVALAGGAIGTVVDIVDEDVLVVHEDRTIGRGPWIVRIWDVLPATDEQATDYHRSCHGAPSST